MNDKKKPFLGIYRAVYFYNCVWMSVYVISSLRNEELIGGIPMVIRIVCAVLSTLGGVYLVLNMRRSELKGKKAEILIIIAWCLAINVVILKAS